MKNTFKKVLATTMVTALCATSAIGISGFTANAATADSNSQVIVQTDNFSKPALRDGVWHGSFNDGTTVRIYFDIANKTATIFYGDGTCVNYNASFISAIGVYKLTDANGNIIQFKVLDNDGTNATLKCGNRNLYLQFDGVDGTSRFTPPIRDGAWHGQFNDGTKVKFYLDSANNKATLIFDDGTVINYHEAFIKAISTYKLTDENGDIAQFRIVERSARHARLQCGNRILTLEFDGVNN